jgi:hypothetical protein
MSKTAPAAPADKVALYEKLVATNPAVKRKGAANPYTSLNISFQYVYGLKPKPTTRKKPAK